MSKKKATKKQVENTDDTKTFTVLIDPLMVQSALQQISKNLNDPEYREQLTKITQASIANTLNTLQRLSQFSAKTSKFDKKEISNLAEGSIDDLMRAYLQFSSDLLVLLQNLSSRTIEILEKASRSEA